MRLTDAIGILYVAFAYAQWAIVGRYTGAPGLWVSVIVMAVANITIVVYSVRQFALVQFPPFLMVALLAASGILNGIAIAVQTNMMADDTLSMPKGIMLTAMFALMIAFVPFLSYVINSESITPLQAGGVMLIIVGVIVVSL